MARFRLDAADIRVIGAAFGLAVGLVVAVALAVDAYLIALLGRAPYRLDLLPGRQLALDLLPWTSAFTAVALAGLVAAASLLGRLRRTAFTRSGFSPTTF